MPKSSFLPLQTPFSAEPGGDYPILITQETDNTAQPAYVHEDGVVTIITILLPLLSLVNRMTASGKPYDNEVAAKIVKGVQAIPSRLQKQQYDKTTIDAAITVVVSWICDQFTSSNLLPLCDEIRQWLLAQNNHFFKPKCDAMLLVTRFCNHAPRMHIQLLALVYWCYAMGYQGQYRYNHNASFHLSQLQQKLYHSLHLASSATVTKQLDALTPAAKQPYTFRRRIVVTLLGLLLTLTLATNIIFYVASDTTVDLLAQVLVTPMN